MKCAGFVVTSKAIKYVLLVDNNSSFEIVEEGDMNLPKGDTAKALNSLFSRVFDFVAEKNVQRVVIKASAATGASVGLSHLRAAELRGVAAAAASRSKAEVLMVQKSQISRSFGARKVDEYVRDDSFWDGALAGDVTKGRREAALLVLAASDD